MADDSIDVKFGAQIGGAATSGVDAVREEIEGVTGPVNDLASSFNDLGQAIIGGLALDQIAEFTGRIVDLGEETLHASETLGIAVPTLSTLNAAFDIAGVGADRAQIAMLRLERAGSESQKGTGPLADAFQRLGISATDMGGHLKSGEELLLEELSDRFKDAPNDVNKLDAAWQIFGRGLGNDLIPFLDRGRAGIEELMQTARGAGAAIDTDLGKEMEQAGEKGRTLSTAITGLGTAIEAQFHFFKDFADAWTTIAEKITQGLGATRQAQLDNLFAQLTSVHESIVKVKADLEQGGWGEFTTNALQSQLKALEAQFAALDEQRKTLIAQMKADAGSGAGSGTKPIGPPSDTTGTASGDNGAADAERQLNEQLRDYIQLIEGARAGTTAYYARLAADAKLALAEGKTTSAQELAQLVTLENEKYALQKRSLQNELSIYGEGSREYQQVLDKMGTAEEQHLAKIDALEEQQAEKQKAALQQQAKAFQEIFTDPVEHAFDGMLQGVLQGNQTWQQALTHSFDNMAVSFIENVAKMIAQWLAFEAVTSVFGGGASSAMGLTAGPLGALFGGGGLGALFGGAGGGGAAADLGALAMFDVGSWSVPSTMPAIVHAGEMIVPADFAGAIRGGAASIGGGGGSPVFPLSVTAINARSVQQLFNDSTFKRLMTNLVQRGLALNPSLNP